MRFKQIRDVLAWTQTLHEQLAREYQALADKHQRQRVGMLLGYLSDHEKALAEALEHYQQDAADRLMATWYDKAPDLDLPDSLEGLCEELDCSDTSQVVTMALRFHDMLTDLYQTLGAEAPTPAVAELFDNLASMEVSEKMRMVRDSEELEDL